MSGFWSIVLNILIFIISLGALIVIHELGHLTAAKIFRVYCYEFSVGMGPALYQHKPNKGKKQETVFSVRALPIGGYVAMAGEDLEDAENVDRSIVVPRDRTIEGKKRWIRIIIFVAGVTMNFILGYLLFFIDYAATPQVSYDYSASVINVESSSLASAAGLESGDKIVAIDQDIYYIDLATGNYGSVPDKTTGTIPVSVYYYEETPDSYLYYNHSINSLLNGKYYNSNSASDITYYLPSNIGDKRVVTFTYDRTEADGSVLKNQTAVVGTLAQESKRYFFSSASLKWGTIGISSQYNIFRYSVTEAFQKAWDMWAYSCSAIFIGIGSLFTPSGFSQVGGIVSIFEISSIAVSAGFSAFLSLWGLISVNLAIMNLLPFPALDGWQILVTLAEGGVSSVRKLTRRRQIVMAGDMTPEEKAAQAQRQAEADYRHRKTYNRIKNIMATVGMVLLLVLAAALIIKDIVFPVIG